MIAGGSSGTVVRTLNCGSSLLPRATRALSSSSLYPYLNCVSVVRGMIVLRASVRRPPRPTTPRAPRRRLHSMHQLPRKWDPMTLHTPGGRRPPVHDFRSDGRLAGDARATAGGRSQRVGGGCASRKRFLRDGGTAPHRPEPLGSIFSLR